MKSTIKIKFLRENAKLPSKYSNGSAGFDLYATEEAIVPASVIDSEGRLDVGRAIVPIGLAIQLPSGTVGKLASRSGLSTQFNIEVGAGWIDNDYRGEIMVELRNFGSQEYRVRPGDRIAQLIVLNVATANIGFVDQLDDSKRGSRGFGSSGR